MKLLYQSLVLILSFAAIFAWQQTIASQYTIQTFGFLVFIYLLLYFSKRLSHAKILFGGVWDIFILNTLVVLVVFATNGLSGGMFFFLYFLAFGIAFVFQPWTILVFDAGAILVFLQQALSSGDVTSNFIKLGTLLLISPLAIFFSLQYQKNEFLEVDKQTQEARDNDVADEITDDAEEVLKNEKSLSKQDRKRLEDVVKEADDLRR